MTLDVVASICKYENFLVKNQFKIYVDNTEILLQDEDLSLGAAPGNDWYNFKQADYIQQELEAGSHVIKMEIIGCNVDYLQFTFTPVE